jgi:hypothetical protein
MKIKHSFQSYCPRGRTMVLKEGDTVPIGWFVSVGGAAPVEITEFVTIIGETVDISNPYDGGPEVFVRYLSVATPSQVAAAIAAKAVEQAEIARITAEHAVWVAANKARDAARKAAKEEAAKEEAVKSELQNIIGIVRAEFVRCGWRAQQQTQLVWGGYDESQVCETGEMYLYRTDSEQEGYSLRDQGSSYFYTTGYRRTETVTAIHPKYAAAIDAAKDAWFFKTAVTADQLLSVIRLSMGDIVIPVVVPPTAEETRAKEAAELASQKAANAARKQARQDEEAAEFAAKKALKLNYRGPQRDTTQAPAEAPAPISSVNLNDPWGSLSLLKL